MTKSPIVLVALAAIVTPVAAEARPSKPRKSARKPAASPAQQQADRYFTSGVALYKEAKYAEALAEFQRAYEIAPHPLVLYNIAGCHRELSQYADAIKTYQQFLAEGKGHVPAARLTAAQAELDGILARIARVTITATPDGAILFVDGNELGTLVEMPLILSPGEHKLAARAPGHRDRERIVRVASGDELAVELGMEALPPEPERGVVASAPPPTIAAPRRFALGAGFGTNLRRIDGTGAPSIGLGLAVTPRLELGLDAVLIAYAVMPSVRLRLTGDALALHAVAAVPVSFAEGDMTGTFVAGAVGLGLRYRATPALALRLESFASFAGGQHGITIPTFLGGELWF